MKKLLILIVLGLTGSLNLFAKPEYPLLSIPEHLFMDANSVVREYDIDFEIHSMGKAVKRFRRVVTLLNETAKDQANLMIGYDKTTKIKSMKGRVYDAAGQEIKKFKKSDIKDYSSISNFSLYEDNRVKVIEFTPPFYPVTIEYEYEKEYAGLVGYPVWAPIYRPKMSVQNSSFKISIPKELKLRYKSIHLNIKPDIKEADGIQSYFWQVSGITANKEWESLMPSYHKLKPLLITAPADFEYEGYQGNLESWENFGKWIYQLNKDRDELPEETQNSIKALITGKTTLEKIRILYQYLQEKTRYVSIQLGIGGFQPFEASLVDEVSYGDCKALSNYMRALLRVAGIDSYPAIINAGSNHYQVIRDFPTFQFNHQILCVPFEKDTIWLECTSQHIPPGYLGEFTGNRYALVVNESGGKLVKTKNYTPEDNFQFRKAIVTIQDNGNAVVSINTRYGGYQFKPIKDVAIMSPEKQKKWLYEHIDLQGVQIQNFSFNYTRENGDMISDQLDLLINNYATVSGKRIFITPNLMNRNTNKLHETENRETSIKIDYPYYDIDSVVYNLPKGYHTEFVPENTSIKSPFGKYTTSISINSDGSILYIRKLYRKSGLYPSDQYGELRSFTNNIVDFDQEKIILKNKT